MHKKLGWIVGGLVRTQAFLIEQAPYANAYAPKKHTETVDPNNYAAQKGDRLGRTGWVGTYNYEMDSGSYFFRLVYLNWKKLGELVRSVEPAIMKILETWRVEQNHDAQSPYRYRELARQGLGPKVNEEAGLSWTAYRPSDDPCQYGYHIPDNMFAVTTLG